MTRHSILFHLSIFISLLSFGQKLGDYYVSIPSDSTVNCRLRFLSDSKVEVSSVPRHMSRQLAIVFNYKSNDTIICVLPGLISKQDSLSLYTSGLNYFIKPSIKLTKIDGGFIDYNKSIIYVKQKEFGENPDVAYIIDGKTYIQDIGVTDNLGVVKKRPKTSKKLHTKLREIDKDNYTIEIVRGLAAYKRFGIKRVYGVIIFTTKK